MEYTKPVWEVMEEEVEELKDFVEVEGKEEVEDLEEYPQ